LRLPSWQKVGASHTILSLPEAAIAPLWGLRKQNHITTSL
jgi:hypothetical protein